MPVLVGTVNIRAFQKKNQILKSADFFMGYIGKRPKIKDLQGYPHHGPARGVTTQICCKCTLRYPKWWAKPVSVVSFAYFREKIASKVGKTCFLPVFTLPRATIVFSCAQKHIESHEITF